MFYWRQLLILIIVILLVPVARSQAPVSYAVPLSGIVRDAKSGAPIGGARLAIAGAEIISASDGSFPTTNIVLTAPMVESNVVVTAKNYQAWSFEDVVLRADQPIEFRVRLHHLAPKVPGATPTQRTPLPTPPVATTPEILTSPPLATPPVPAATPEQSPLPEYVETRSIAEAPEYITIGITGSKNCMYDTAYLERIPVVRVRFVDYVRDVLPNEWIPSWPMASLEAGAVAAKQFAWYNAFVRQKWRRYGYHFDLLDSTCDQVYMAGSARTPTDAAIASTWQLVLTRNGTLFETGYRAYDAQCPVNGDCMGQWGSKYRADAGATGTQILQSYYRGSSLEQIGPNRCTVPGESSRDPNGSGRYRVYLPMIVNCKP